MARTTRRLLLEGLEDRTLLDTGNRVSLAVQDLGNGQPTVLDANQQTDRITLQPPAAPGIAQFVPVVTLADGTRSTLAPGAVQGAKLDKNSPFFDAVVVGSGSNIILVYRGTGFDASGRPIFAAPQTYFVGTAPTGVTIQDVNGDGIPDMSVANEGSNDVSVLLGAFESSGDWIAKNGPRLQSGGAGPIATALRDLNGDGIPDLVVTNRQSGTLPFLPDRGQGFFDDRNPKVLNIPGNSPIRSSSFMPGTSGGVVVTSTGQVIEFNLTDFLASVRTVFTLRHGQGVEAIQALANGDLIAALDGGTVVYLIQPDLFGTLYAFTFVALSGMPSDSSSLEVLASDQVQVLVTNAGEDQLFAFVLHSVIPNFFRRGPPQPPGPLKVEFRPPTGGTGPPTGGTLTLVITLVAAGIPTGEGVQPVLLKVTELNDLKLGGATALAGAALGGATVHATVDKISEGDESDLEEEGVRTEPGHGGLDVEEKLRQQDWYERMKGPDGPSSHRPSLPLMGLEEALAALREEHLVPLQPEGPTQALSPRTDSLWAIELGGDILVPGEEDLLSLRPTDIRTANLYMITADQLSPGPGNDEPCPAVPTREIDTLVWLAVALAGSATWFHEPLPVEVQPRRSCRVPRLR
jgi:hypothetical protein